MSQIPTRLQIPSAARFDQAMPGAAVVGSNAAWSASASGLSGRASATDFHRRGLAGPVRPEQAEELARGDVETHAADGLHSFVCLAQVAHLDRSHALEGRKRQARTPVARVLNPT